MERKFNVEITADERLMLITALSAVITLGREEVSSQELVILFFDLKKLGPASGEWSALARRLIDLSCQPSSSIQPAAPEKTSPAVAPTRAPAPDAHTRGKDAGAGTREIPEHRGSVPGTRFPQTIEQLSDAGYKLLPGSPAFCRACGKPIEWWETPSGKKTPMNVGLDHARVSHFATCTKADEFRK